MEAGALDQDVVVVRAMLRQLGRAEDAERLVAGERGGKLRKVGLAANTRAANGGRSLLLHGTALGQAHTPSKMAQLCKLELPKSRQAALVPYSVT
jgi:hypothetical protein